MPVSEGPNAKAGSTKPAGAPLSQVNADATRSGKEAYNHGSAASPGKEGGKELDHKRKEQLPKSVD